MAKYRVGIFTMPDDMGNSDTVDFEFPNYEQAMKFVEEMVVLHDKFVYIVKLTEK